MTLYALVLINHETFHFMKTVIVLSNTVSTISKREREFQQFSSLLQAFVEHLLCDRHYYNPGKK